MPIRVPSGLNATLRTEPSCCSGAATAAPVDESHTRAVAPLPVSSAERDSVIRDIESRGPTGLDFSRIPATKPAILRMTVDDKRSLDAEFTCYGRQGYLRGESQSR